jgi:NADH:ubiquinone oxidoreductase subunit 5 (subunit L)/multisubunit Na+/H+ antiporter MnhA subunit
VRKARWARPTSPPARPPTCPNNAIHLVNPLLPGIGALINGLVGIRLFSRKAAGTVACTMMVAALGLSLVAFWQLSACPVTLASTT